jgi:hypothetical protein
LGFLLKVAILIKKYNQSFTSLSRQLISKLIYYLEAKEFLDSLPREVGKELLNIKDKRRVWGYLC